ncbi:universal stress protein [Bacillus carboniphilus]|uniref:Universal stress protein n=1 Tax=Bacillus carboniphilus TaxID=86663 RepID=A0ABY9JR30_9BACI|nr:universal stress protein [Bacillus carboniphilus]WLR41787.1 universal stress protein [Bacillus carboniphilus]
MTHQYEKILVAVDGSNQAEFAFKKAIAIAKRNHAELIIAHVLDTRFGAVEAYDPGIVHRVEYHAKDLLEKYEKQAEEAGLTEVTIHLGHGSAKHKIAKDVAPMFDVDLIICGATGLNAVERFFMGSVSEHITRHAQCDVLIVRSK